MMIYNANFRFPPVIIYPIKGSLFFELGLILAETGKFDLRFGALLFKLQIRKIFLRLA